MPEPLPPGSTIGILGGGQLGRMLAVAASRLGLKTHIYSDEQDAPAFDVAAKGISGAYEDEVTLTGFARDVDIITCEFENVPAKALEIVGRAAPVFPPAKSFAVAQDRLAEKDFISELGIPVAPYAAIDSADTIRDALPQVKTPALLKTRRFGYDGKGQVLVRAAAEAESAWQDVGSVPSVLESLLRFEREISIIAVRGQNGDVQYYDAVENVHQGGILATSRVPARISDSNVYKARRIAGAIADALGHVGVLCVEMFQREGEGPDLTVNEIAPRVHNSGHWTIDACPISQFENHVRAICAWPLGETGRHSDALMTNLIGSDVDHWRALAEERGTAVHLYGKAEARPGRKMGHVTRLFPES